MLNPRYIIHPYSDLTTLSQAGADFWIDQAQQAIALRGAFHVALTGGATPQPLYRLLARPDRADKIDWSRVHIFIGDERYVPHDHPDSNFGMAGGVGYYEDRSAASMSVIGRLGAKSFVTAGVGVGFDSGSVGARGGFQFEW